MLDVNTKLITLLGNPVSQTFSVRMQNRAYDAAGVNLLYFATETRKETLGDIVRGIRCMPFAGFAVTKPDKVDILPYLDALDPLCEKMGACNTVVKTEDGRLIGYNTDGIGFYRSIVECIGDKLDEHSFLCFGAGGAARAICSVLAYYGAGKIYITSRTADSARRLTGEINARFAPVAETVPPGEYRSVLSGCTVVINASGVGMGASEGHSPMDKEDILPGALYFDACYNPTKTQFLADAEERGCRILNGLGMLLYQGAAQFELWTGQEAPVDVMREEIETIISGQ